MEIKIRILGFILSYRQELEILMRMIAIAQLAQNIYLRADCHLLQV